jgi:hypothetical protein
MSDDQYTFQDPAAMYSGIDTTAQQQDGPGLDADLQETADRGERSYRGSGRLEGRKALITGADSGIGAAVAIAYAREGADVALSYLPEEEEDAKKVVALIATAGRPSPSPATSPRPSSAASSSRRPSRASAASTSSSTTRASSRTSTRSRRSRTRSSTSPSRPTCTRCSGSPRRPSRT